MRRIYVAWGLAALLLVLLAIAVTNRPVSKPDDPYYAEFTAIADPPWSAPRGRRCGLIDLAAAPERAGATLQGTLKYSQGAHAHSLEWAFRDATGTRVFSSVAANCYTHIKVKKEAGKYTWAFTQPTDTVAHDPTVDAAAGAATAFQACFPADLHLSAPLTVATVVDTDGSVWTTDETTEPTEIRACAARELDAWVRAQIAAGSFRLAAPAVVFGVYVSPPAAAPGPASAAGAAPGGAAAAVPAAAAAPTPPADKR